MTDDRPSIAKTLLICAAWMVFSFLLFCVSDSEPSGIIFIVSIIMLMGVYVIPTFCAFYRGHPNRWFILLINVFGGATVFLWFACLFWAFSDYVVGEAPTVNLVTSSPLPLDNPGQMDHVGQLERLSELRTAGLLTDEEYRAAKQRILSAPT